MQLTLEGEQLPHPALHPAAAPEPQPRGNLTEDVGHPALAQHLHAVTGIMRASSSWQQFHGILDRAFPKRGSVLQLELIET
jgi:hypothetical protein